MRRFALFTLVVLLFGLTACAQQPSPFVGFYKDLATCREEFVALDARVAAAGVGDAAYHRVPGYPYLRTDRTLASYAHEVQSFEQVAGWIRRMREFDQEAREFEYTNLGMTIREKGGSRSRMQICSGGLAGIELDSPAALKKLRDTVQPPDEYSGFARTLGLYPLAVPILNARVGAEQEAVRREFATPLAELTAEGPLMLWQVKPLKDPELAAVGLKASFPDELGFPGLSESQWQALAEINAPELWIETAGEQDLPATPLWTEQGVSADSKQPLVNYTISFSRFAGKPVVQIVYFVWFKGAPGAQPLDGSMWRTTLDLKGQPLLFESLHTSGRAHRWFPAQPLERRPNGSVWHEPELFPQEQVPAGRPTLRLAAGTHALRRVVSPEQATANETRSYELRRYEDLYLLKLPGGGTRSLFGPDGIVPGTDRPDPIWLWSSGLSMPGALRQYGHHATAYVGRRHFDDPLLLDTVFVPPAEFLAPAPTPPG
ncbi:MAG: hypothetical protein ACT4PZ_15465 [Panacagrimonas sp.]